MSSQMIPHAGPLLAPRPPLAAYREDLARCGDRGAFGQSDGTWLSVAAILSHALQIPANSRPALLPIVRDIVGADPALRDVLSASEQGAAAETDADAVTRIVRRIVWRVEDDVALRLAYSMLSLLVDSDLGLSVLERGRVFAQRGRVCWKAGALDIGREQYGQADALGRTARIPELRVRAWIGYSIIARLRGNYPEVRKWGARAAQEAERVGLPDLASLAYHSLMVSAAVAGDLNGALAYGWRAFEWGVGDRRIEAHALLNLSQYLLESGEPEAAVKGFLATIERQPPPRAALPALGGLALAAAAVGDCALVRAAKTQVEEMIAAAPLPYESASTLLELVQALTAIGDEHGAAACRVRALDLARRHSYHEIVHRLEALRGTGTVGRPKPAPALDPEAIAIVCAVASLTSGARREGAA